MTNKSANSPVSKRRRGPARKWAVRMGIALAIGAAALLIAAALVGRHFDPYIREQAVKYLQDRFESEAELTSLRIRVPALAPLRILLRGGRGARVSVRAENLSLRHHGRTDVPPMFVLKNLTASVDLGTLFDEPKTVPLVTLDGMEINVPPKGERPDFGGRDKPQESQKRTEENPGEKEDKSTVVIDRVLIRNAKLTILPKDRSKVPLRFDLMDVRLQSAGKNVPMKYEAALTIPKPPGEVHSTGTFGPWVSGEPGDTPLNGKYLFDNADLGIFNGIAGILRSTGNFQGTLSSITARGQATIPDFRLKQSGNPVPLATTFEVLVDGTNGNTELKPAVATLGSTRITTSGTVIRHEGDLRKTISLDVSIPAGNVRDVLKLAMKGSPFMEGKLALATKLAIPPLTGKVKEKLLLDGTFEITGGRFLRSNIQSKIDALSRRGQGEPGNKEIDEAVHRLSGDFNLEDEIITFRTLAFAIPGAAINIGGNYDIGRDQLDFQGALMLDARVSETVTGWKRWVLKPVDPFFAKRGAGTFLHIKVEGSSKNARFGLNRGGTSPAEEAEKKAEAARKAAQTRGP